MSSRARTPIPAASLANNKANDEPVLAHPARSPELLSLLTKTITLALTLGLHPTALFVSERYSCLCPHSEAAIFYHALCLLRSNEPRQALEMLKSTLVHPPGSTQQGIPGLLARRPACETSIRCAWVFAEACFALGRPQEGGECLRLAYDVYGRKNSRLEIPERIAYPPAAYAALNINLTLAKAAVAANKPEEAAERYRAALETRWWCWEAWEGLCQLGLAPDPNKYFAPVPVPAVTLQPDPEASSATTSVPTLHQQQAHRDSSEFARARTSPDTATHPHATPSNSSHFQRHLPPRYGADASQSQRSHLSNTTGPHATPVETGAALQFSEGAFGDAITEDADKDIEISADEPFVRSDLGNDSSFFGPRATRKGPIGGLFGKFGNAPHKRSGSPLFGAGLLLGKTDEAVAAPVQSTSNGSTSQFTSSHFVTPDQAKATSTFRFNGLNGRPAPGAKRNRQYLDADEALPVTSLNFGPSVSGNQQLQVDGSGRPIRSGSIASTHSSELHADAGHGRIHLSRENGFDEDEDDNFSADTRPTRNLQRKASTSANLIRRSSRAPSGLESKAHLIKSRIVSNPRERKRTKAGPSNFDETLSSVDSAQLPSPRSWSPPSPIILEPYPATNGKLLSVPLQKTTSSSSHTPVELKSAYRSQVDAVQKALAENWLRSVFRSFANAYAKLSHYDCNGAVSTVLELDKSQETSSRALLILAQAHFGSLNYPDAEQAFRLARRLAPCNTRGMDVYSTLLWHLHKPTELSFLAQELMDQSPRLPEAWIATGNVFSHLEDHANALKCFKRAIQCDDNSFYAYTLAGHECATLEEWETAVGFFREAVRRNPRHYNAYFGLGNVYLKTGKHRMAEWHFRHASSINPANAMLVCCIGTMLEKQHKKTQALWEYERACLLAPKSPAVRFKRVRVLMELRKFDAALRDLLIVRDLAPDEFNVHYLLGKLYGMMGDKARMTQSLTYAQDLEPRAAGRIRELIENAGRLTDADSSEDDQNHTGADVSMVE